MSRGSAIPRILAAACFVALLAGALAGAGEEAPPGRTVVVPIHGEIDLGLAPFVERILGETGPADTVLFDINTMGGRIDAAILIRDAILGAKSRTVGFVNPRAISAGALIALATDTLVMSDGATIGAATPVQIEGGKMVPVEAKVVSYMRKEMKATAEAKRRRGDIAEAMVDATVAIPGLDDDKSTLTLTTTEAVKLHYVTLVAPSVAELCRQLKLAAPARFGPALNWAERLARFLSSSVVSSLLMTLGMLGILIELWAPGHALAGLLGLACLLLFFFGHLVVHLAGFGEILLFAAGLAALGIEIFFWPGHGALAALGVLGILGALVMALLGLGRLPFEISWSLGWVGGAVVRVAASLLLTTAGMVVAARLLPRTRLGRPLILTTAITATAGAAEAQGGDDPGLVGAVGRTETPLRPAGKIQIRGRRYDVVTDGELIAAGVAVVVRSVADGRVVVAPQKSERAS